MKKIVKKIIKQRIKKIRESNYNCLSSDYYKPQINFSIARIIM